MLHGKILRILNFFPFCKIHTYSTTSMKQYLPNKRCEILVSEIIREYFGFYFPQLLNNEFCSIISPMDELWIFLSEGKLTSIISTSLSMNSQFFYFVLSGFIDSIPVLSIIQFIKINQYLLFHAKTFKFYSQPAKLTTNQPAAIAHKTLLLLHFTKEK